MRLGGAGPRALSVGLVWESRYWYARDAWPSVLELGQLPALTRRVILPLSTRSGRP